MVQIRNSEAVRVNMAYIKKRENNIVFIILLLKDC